MCGLVSLELIIFCKVFVAAGLSRANIVLHVLKSVLMHGSMLEIRLAFMTDISQWLIIEYKLRIILSQVNADFPRG